VLSNSRRNALCVRLAACECKADCSLKGVRAVPVPLTTLNDQLDPEAVPKRDSLRSIAQLCLLAILLLEWPRRAGCFVFGSPELVVIAVAVLLSWGIQARQWLLIGATVGIVGFNTWMSSLETVRGGSNESAAVANLRTISTAEVTYLSSSGGRYGTIEDLIAARLLDDTFTGTKAGYNYTVTSDATSSGYTAEAVPVSSRTGRYGYYSVPDAVVRYSTDASLAPAGQSGRSVQ